MERSYAKGRQAEIPTTRDDPAIGRFLSVDPHGSSYPELNPYHYVGNNPLRFIDPTGMDSTDSHDDTKTKEASSVVEPLPLIFPTIEAGALRFFGVLGIIFSLKSDSRQDDAEESSENSSSKQDKKLSKGEVKALVEGVIDVHDLKGEESTSKFDLFKDKKGNIKLNRRAAKVRESRLV